MLKKVNFNVGYGCECSNISGTIKLDAVVKENVLYVDFPAVTLLNSEPNTVNLESHLNMTGIMFVCKISSSF